MRCKTMTLPGKVSDVKELKEWNFDGSSTKQAPGHDSDVFLVRADYLAGCRMTLWSRSLIPLLFDFAPE